MSRRACVVVSVVVAVFIMSTVPASSAPEDVASTKPDYIALRSDAGDPLGLGSRQLIQKPSTLFFSVSFPNKTSMIANEAELSVDFEAPTGQDLVPGTYSVVAAGAPATASSAAFRVRLHDRTCTGPAEFTVLEYVPYPAQPTRLAVDFRGWCGTSKTGPSYSGSGRIRATPPRPRTVAAPVRIAGADRIETAIKISRDRFPSTDAVGIEPEEQVKNVVLARSDLFADSLGGAVLAGSVGGPILLTPSTGALDSRTLAEVERVLDGGTVFVLGGVAAISAVAQAELEGHGHAVIRVAGADRFETAALAADFVEQPRTAYLVTGRNFPDGLAAAAIAVLRRDAVILLTDDGAMPAASSAWIAGQPSPIGVVAIGGPAAQTKAASHEIVGADRYETALKLVKAFDGAFGVDWPSIGLASGETFADALAGGAHIGSLGGPLLLTPHTAAPQGVRDFISSRTRDTVVIYGGAGAVAPEVEATL